MSLSSMLTHLYTMKYATLSLKSPLSKKTTRSIFMTNHPTADLARFCAQLHYEDLSATVRERIRYLLLDHLAVTLCGSTLPSSLAGYQMLEQMAIGSTHGVTIFGRQERAVAEWASLVNGIAAHGLEMDDVENRSSL